MNNKKITPLFFLFFCFTFFNPFSLYAHPHMFIDVMAKFMINDTTLSGFYVYWDFDDMNSAYLIDEFDNNKNNCLEKKECISIEKNFNMLNSDNYYICLSFGNKFLKINKIEHFVASIKPGKILQYSFFVPCNIKLDLISDKNVVMFFKDPTMYIDFALKKNHIKASTNDKWVSNINISYKNYTERIILDIKRKQN